MRDLSAAAATSVGSLYHFFPDKQSVFESLTQRHLAGVQTTVRSIALTRDSDWLERSPVAVVESLIGPLLCYAAEHPDFIALGRQRILAHQANREEVRGELLALYRRVLALRLPRFRADDLDRYTYVLLQLPIGLIGEEIDREVEQLLLLEVAPRVLGAYLEALENVHAQEVGRDGNSANA